MSTVTTLVHDLRELEGVSNELDGLRLRFLDGSHALLESDHSDFTLLAAIVMSRGADPAWLGILLDADGRVVDLGAVHDTGVRQVREFPGDPTRLDVAFWAFASVCCLTSDHPDFDGLREILTGAVSSQEVVRMAITHEWEEREDDGMILGYPKILSVRRADRAGAKSIEPGFAAG